MLVPVTAPPPAQADGLAQFLAIPATLPGFLVPLEQNVVIGNPNWFAFGINCPNQSFRDCPQSVTSPLL